MPISRQSQWILALVLIGLIGACQPDEAPDYPKAPDQIEPLHVQDANAPLGAPLRLDAAGVQVQRPAGWTALDSMAALRAHRSVAVDTTVVQTKPLRVFGEQRTSSFLAIARIRVNSGDIGSIIQHHLTAHNPDFLRVDTLQGEEQPLIDLVIASRSAVHHKVLMIEDTDTTAVQFDFVTPRFQYPRIAPLIAASVASIRRAE